MNEHQKHLRQIALELTALLGRNMTPDEQLDAVEKARILKEGVRVYGDTCGPMAVYRLSSLAAYLDR